MGSGGTGTGGAAADLDGSDGRLERGLLGGLQELAAIFLIFHTQAFHVQQQYLGIFVLSDIADEVIEADIHLIADGGPAAVTEVAAFGIEVDVDTKVAALQHEAHGAGGQIDDARIEAHGRTVHPHAVGAHDAQIALAGHFQHLAFDLLALGTGLAKARGDDDGGLHALFGTLLDDGDYMPGGNGHDGQVHFTGHGKDVGIGGVTEDFTAGSGDQIDVTLELVVYQALGCPVAVFLRIGRSADKSDAFGTKERDKVRHCIPPGSSCSHAAPDGSVTRYILPFPEELILHHDANSHIRADDAADIAFDAFFRMDLFHIIVSLAVDMGTDGQYLLGAGIHTQATGFAATRVNDVNFNLAHKLPLQARFIAGVQCLDIHFQQGRLFGAHRLREDLFDGLQLEQACPG